MILALLIVGLLVFTWKGGIKGALLYIFAVFVFFYFVGWAVSHLPH